MQALKSATEPGNGCIGRVCESYLPARILKRKKRGFAANVVDDWFRLSLDGKISGSTPGQKLSFVRAAQACASPQTSGSPPIRGQDNHKLLFSLVMFEQWLRRVRSNRPPVFERNSLAV